MTNIMRAGAELLSEQRHASMSESVVYKRDAQSVAIAATVGSVQASPQDTEGMIVDAESVDFIIRAADLVLGGSGTTPQDGDTIEYDAGGGVIVYQVRRDELDQVYRPCDEYGLDWRVHTKRLGASS